MQITTIASIPLLISRALDDYGVDAEPLLRRADIDPGRLADPHRRVPFIAITRLWNLAVQASGDECFGLTAARYWHPTTFHALGYAWLASDSLEDALNRLIRYVRIVNTGMSARVDVSGGDARLSLELRPEARDVRPADAAVDAGLAMLAAMCQMIYPEDLSLRAVEMPREHAPSCAARLRSHFRAPIRYGARGPALVLAASMLREPLPTANAELAHVNEQVVARYLAELDREDTAMRVQAFLVDHLPSGEVREEAVAEHLHMSLRSLQRRLQEQGTSYKTLLEQTRRELATRYVSRTRLSINEITFLLGFTEPANFSRAFKRWHGTSPTAYRERVGA